MIEIRPARLEDCACCAELSRVPELRAADGSYISEGFYRHYVDEDELFLVAEEEGIVVGYILVEPCKGKVAYVHFLAVDSVRRGRGIGRALMEAATRRAKTLGHSYLFLHAPEKKNPRTAKFYRSLGMLEEQGYTAFGINLDKEKHF